MPLTATCFLLLTRLNRGQVRNLNGCAPPSGLRVTFMLG
jgi:hypothetical protein